MRLFIFALSILTFVGAANAAIKTQVIEYKHGDTTLVGFLAYDDAVATENTPRPGIVVCHEWWGNNEYAHSRARQLAEAGYVAFAIDMYGKAEDGKARTTQDPAQASKWAGEVNSDPKVFRERARAGYDQLVAQKFVDKTKIGAIGYCMGGTVALELARSGADVKAIVPFHASRIAAADPADNKKLADNRATVLVCHGQEDTFVAPEEITKFHQQMKEAGVDYEFDSYAAAVHSFTNPKADATKLEGVKYNAKADRRSWARMLALFEEKFAPPADTTK